MKVLNSELESRMAEGLAEYFDSIRRAKRRALFLDYDGTLAPFVVQRDQAFPYPGVREILTRIIADGGCRLIVVSGRRVQDLIPLLGLSARPEIWGTHGLERLTPGESKPELGPVPKAALTGLAKAKLWAQTEGLDEHLETKIGALAVHWRGVPKSERDEVLKKVTEHWLPICEGNALVLHSFDGGLELRIEGQNKAIAVRTVLAEMGPEPAAAAYLGDDLTDEDAFQELKGKGLCVLVRPELRDTHADLWLKPPEELLGFLEGWAEACRKPG